MRIGTVTDIFAIGMMCACGNSCVNDAGSYMITPEDKIASCEVCYAQYRVTEDLFLVLPKQLRKVREDLKDILMTTKDGSWEALSHDQLVSELRKMYHRVEAVATLVEKG